MRIFYIIQAMLLLSCIACTQKSDNVLSKLEVDNINQRLDDEGNIVDAHDGIILQDNGMFYLYGTAYGENTGFTRENKYVCYSSKNLKDWHFEGEIMSDEPSGIYYRPRVIYNEETKKYILWYNWYPKLWNGKFGVAVSDKPTGPFEIVNSDVQVAHSNLGVGDFGIFKDDDNVAYIAYNTIQGHRNSVERLNNDYLSSTMENGGFIAENCEAGSIFKREGKYYMLTDYTCCFCTQGSGARVYVSDNPLSGYKLRGNINRYIGEYAPILQDKDISPNMYYTLKNKNEEHCNKDIKLVFDKETSIDELKFYQFTGNRWGMCGDTLASRTHSRIIKPILSLFAKQNGEWKPISYETCIDELALSNVIKMNFEAISAKEFKIEVDTYETGNGLFVNEISAAFESKELDTERKTYVCDNATLGRPIIPAQQSDVLTIKRESGDAYIWIGDLWGSASDNVKGHDYMYWSAPLEFDEQGDILPMKWVNNWSLDM